MPYRELGMTFTLVLAACSSAADINQVHGWAKSCGMGDLKMFVSGEDASKIVIAETRIGGQPWGDPTATETAMLKRQRLVERAVRCMEPKAKAAGLKIDYPVGVAY